MDFFLILLSKIIIINSATDKIIKIIEEIFSKKDLDITIVIESDALEKKSNLNNDIRKEMIKYQKYIKENCIDVGENFAYEARKVYYNNKKSKAIYGKATKEEISELEEEGIETLTVPWLKKIEN